jgi:hypothetical protein
VDLSLVPANICLEIVQSCSAGTPAFGVMLPDQTEGVGCLGPEHFAKPGKDFGTTTSANPQSPNTEQVSADKMDTATPWKFTEPMPPKGEKPGGESPAATP